MIQWRKTACCAGCGQKIAEHLTPDVMGIQVFHPSCGKRYREMRRVQPTKVQSPRVIGAVCGIALPFGQYCNIFDSVHGDRFEYFDYGAFDASIARGGQSLQIDHFGVPIPGQLTLFTGPDLRFRLHVHDSAFGQTVLEKVKRGVFRGVSIRFRPRDERPGKYNSTVVYDADLVEISLCEKNGPAWCGTTVWVE